MLWSCFNALSRPKKDTSCLASLTQLLQGGDPELVIMVVGQWRHAFPHDFRRDGLSRHLHCIHTTDEGLEPLVGKWGLTPIQLYDPAGAQKELKTWRTHRWSCFLADMLKGDADSLVQVIECVGDANRHLHSSLRGQFLNSCISLFPEGLRVVLVRQTRNVPFLEEKQREPQSRIIRVCTMSLKQSGTLCLKQMTALPWTVWERHQWVGLVLQTVESWACGGWSPNPQDSAVRTWRTTGIKKERSKQGSTIWAEQVWVSRNVRLSWW